MHLAAILPTVNLWGGVKRFCELGNRFVRRGHRFTLVSPGGLKPEWFQFEGDALSLDNVRDFSCDAVFCTEPAFLQDVLLCKTTVRIFYHVLKNESLRPVLAHPEMDIFANSSGLQEFDRRRWRIDPFLAAGGVDTSRFCPQHRDGDGPITVLTYGRLGMLRKGTRFVVRACERLHRKGLDIKLLLFDTPLDENGRAAAKAFSAKVPFEFILDYPVARTNELFNRADIFASAEKNAGWANTCAEAMACGLAVAATTSGAEDFLVNGKTGLVVHRNSWSLERAIATLAKDPELRARLGTNARRAIEAFDWENLAERILARVRERLA